MATLLHYGDQYREQTELQHSRFFLFVAGDFRFEKDVTIPPDTRIEAVNSHSQKS